jgi:peptidyl-prolyl cis-trans isomerase C
MVLLLSLLACQTPAPTPGDLPRTGEVLETINGQPFTQGTLDAVLTAMPPEAREQIEANNQMPQLQEQLITQEMLYQEALNRSLHTDAKVKTQIALAEREALVAALLNDIAEAAATDEALKAWYDEHQVQFRKSEAKFAQIVVDDEEAAKAVVADVAGGADFGELAKERSIDTATGANGGDMGWIDTRQLPPDLATFAAGEPGTLTEPKALPNGAWFVLNLIDKREEVQEFETVKEEIKPKVQQEAVMAFVEEQKAAIAGDEGEATIEVPEPGAEG